MNISDYINLGLLSILIGFKTTRYAAVTILAGYLLYFLAIEPLSGKHYYHGAALLNLSIGYVLFPRYKLVALLSFCLIIVNNIGLMLYKLDYEPTLYNGLSLFIIITQILLLYIRILTSGHRIGKTVGVRGRALVWIANPGRIQARFEVPKRQKGKD